MLLLPAALLVSVAVTASVGGGLSGLGQVFVGPTVPEVAEAAQSNGTRSADEGTAVTGGFSAIPAVSILPARLLAEQTTGERRRSTRRRRGQTRKPATQQPSRHVPSSVTEPSGGQAPPSGGQQNPPQQPPPSQGGPIRQIGKVVRDAVASIPVAGPPAADVVQTVIDLVEPPPAPQPPVAAAQS